LKSTFF